MKTEQEIREKIEELEQRELTSLFQYFAESALKWVLGEVDEIEE